MKLTKQTSRMLLALSACTFAVAAVAQPIESNPKDKQAGGKGKPALTAASKEKIAREATSGSPVYSPGGTTIPGSMKAWVGDDTRGYSASDIRNGTGRPPKSTGRTP